MGEIPDWYPLIRAARYLRVAPWELAERGVGWMRAALTAEAAENEARAEQARQAQG